VERAVRNPTYDTHERDGVMGRHVTRSVPRQESLGRLARRLVTGLYTWGGLVLFILALAILGLPAVPQLRRSVERIWDHGETGREVLETSRRAARNVQRFLATATLTSAITGVLSGLFALGVGLEFAFLWG
jgi:predicted PurR-regulated permease PerM